MGDHAMKRQKVGGQVVLKLAVPSASAQCFITADLIKEISQYYSAQVQVDPTDFHLMGEPVRRVVITSASVDCNTLAQQRVSQIIDHYDKGGRSAGNMLTLRVLVENRYAGLIIGKGGSTIRELQSQSLGAKIQLARKEEMPPNMMETDRCVTLVGSLEQVTKAQDLMTKKLESFKELQASNRFVPQPRPNDMYQKPPMSHSPHQQPMYQNQQFRGQMHHQPQPPSYQPPQHYRQHQQQQHQHQPHHQHPSSHGQMSMHQHNSSYDEYATQPGKLALVIPASQMGIVVGKGGSNLKAAIEQCQNSVRIQQEKIENTHASQMVGQSMRSINIQGPIAMVHKAAGLLLARIHTHITNKRCSQWTSIFYPLVNPDMPVLRSQQMPHAPPQGFPPRGFHQGPPPTHQNSFFQQRPQPAGNPPPGPPFSSPPFQPKPTETSSGSNTAPPPPPLEGRVKPENTHARAEEGDAKVGDTQEVAKPKAVTAAAAEEDEEEGEAGARGIKRKLETGEEHSVVEQQETPAKSSGDGDEEVVEATDEGEDNEEDEVEKKEEEEEEQIGGKKAVSVEEIEKMTKAQLKEVLTEKGLDTNGLKAALVKRLKEAVEAE